MEDQGTTQVEVSSPAEPSWDSEPLALPQWSVAAALGLTAFAVAATLGGGVAAAAVLSFDLDAQIETVLIGLALCVPYVMTIGLLALVSRRSGVSLAEKTGLRRAPASQVVPLAFAVALGLRAFAGFWAILLQALGVKLPGAEIDPTALLPAGPVGIAFTVLAACILAPIAEEMVFRGVLLPALMRRWGAGVGIVVSSAAFAAVHIYPFAMVPVFVLALVLARLYLRSRTLWLPIAVHMFFNTLGVVALYALRFSGRL